MKNITSAFVFLFLFAGNAHSAEPVQGLYKAVLQHEGSQYYQVANITLRAVQGDGQLKISGNVRVFFGDWNSNEFLTYEFDTIPYNFITGQMTIRSERNDVSFIGIFKPNDGTIEGEWFSTMSGRVGRFSAKKGVEPSLPQGGLPVKMLTGHYRGKIENTNPESNLPERVTISLVTTQDTTGPNPGMKISGNTRLYLGEFGSFEYIEIKLTDIQYNFYNRYLTIKTAEYGLTYKGYVTQDGVFSGLVFADGIGEAGKISVKVQ